MKLVAKWIWKKQAEYNTYNDAIIARKIFALSAFTQASAYVTADSFYRLKINGLWVNDGPSRAWPEHFKYDVIDVTSYLREGRNDIEITARYYGCGDFHRICRQAGLLAQFDIKLASGENESVITDSSWKVASLPGLVRNTPKISIQQCPYEIYDAQLEDTEKYTKAEELYETKDGPWKGLTKRDVKLLSKEPVSFQRFMGASVVRYEGEGFCFPAVRLMYPGVIEAQLYTAAPCGFASIIKVAKKCTLEVSSPSLKISVDGKTKSSGKYALEPGQHLLLSFVDRLPDEVGPSGHEKERTLRLICSEKYSLKNPVDPAHENPWVFIDLGQFAFIHDDLDWNWTIQENPDLAEKGKSYVRLVKQAFAEVVDIASFKRVLGEFVTCKPSKEMLMDDRDWRFSARQVMEDGNPLIEKPDALMHDNCEWTTIKPSKNGDIELAYDLGEQRMGYFQVELVSAAAVDVQFNGIEHIAKDGGIQFSDVVCTARNGMNYITKEGLNKFTSLQRRSGRFIYITLRDQKKPVKIRLARMIESTYPVQYLGSFSCSDARLDRIWDISTRTLKLCMEDTFTDCPLYEQTLWVGDARNESLFAYPVFGSTDIAKSCIDIASHSLERFPMVSCQLPSAWSCIIPIWSFLWGITVWDYYWQTGDVDFVKKRFKLVIKNLKGAAEHIEESGLFSATMWNLFDWADIDQSPKNVLHNSLFMVGAIDAALKCAKAIGDSRHDEWMNSMRKGLVGGLNALWDEKKKSYPDSIRDDGTISPQTCRHTSFLSVLYGVANNKNIGQVKANTIQPLKGMTEVGSPFAILYLYEALEKIGADDVTLKNIYDNYLPMLEAGATTVWEAFPGSPTSPDGTRFPTRSHCHAWSSAPTYFLNRIVLGIRQSAPGGAAFTVSPQLSGLTWANGRTASAKGVVEVDWTLNGKELHISIKAPEGIKCRFVKNSSMKGLGIFVNGKNS